MTLKRHKKDHVSFAHAVKHRFYSSTYVLTKNENRPNHIAIRNQILGFLRRLLRAMTAFSIVVKALQFDM